MLHLAISQRKNKQNTHIELAQQPISIMQICGSPRDNACRWHMSIADRADRQDPANLQMRPFVGRNALGAPRLATLLYKADKHKTK